MRFLKAIIWLFLVTVPFILFLVAISFFNLDFIGQGNHIANINYYILDQNPNLPNELRHQNALDVLNYGIFNLLIYLTIFWLLINVTWIAIGEFLNIDRPSKAIKYIWLWSIFFIVCITGTLIMNYLVIYIKNDIWHYIDEDVFRWKIQILSFFYAAIYFYLCSIFSTSRVMRPAVPLLNIILRN
jgi:hypothetical protein